ncbi:MULTISPECIES: acyl-CoA dehydrogenase family protein [Pseudomonadota]|jgi:alkylation response protein AidB-like acyl-CoA dehydrogenase|uniref:acyl-CoA dehydrogenase family protein n=1 Tax=Pseudomonadota TaxID=1224 RepID=UPI000769A9E2|nr:MULTISPECIES: acyl-CoA dehydrogenase family protein [Pseudomonadota]MCH2236321.1 acyl-CoA dehydrogenase family protein [Blastomonas sp.]OHC94694.1 MAG: acyl-CoA dehydrogenase [Sphingomonadales bacterium RIFCSPHIGHO2_01_FULL_65_20]
MNLDYGPEYERFRAEVRDFLDRNRQLAPESANRAARPSAEAVAWQNLLLENGYTARTIPREYGGYGAEPDILKARIIAEEFARAGVPGGLSNQGISMLVPTLLELGTEEQKRRWIEPTLRGEVVWCQGYSEPGAGSDLASLRTSAREESGHFVINGQKIWTSTARQADMIFCLVRTEPDAPKHAGISYLIFPMDLPGIEVRPLKTMTGHAEFNETFFTDVRVPVDQIVGQRGQGWFVANATLGHERGMLGDPDALENRLLALIRLMREEQVGPARAIDNPVLRDRLVALQAEVAAMKYNGMRVLSNQIKGEAGGMAKLIVKLQSCELAHQISALAIDAMGEMGILYAESPRQREGGSWQWNYMFQLGLIIGGGTAQIQKNIIAERGLNMPREPRPAPEPSSSRKEAA